MSADPTTTSRQPAGRRSHPRRGGAAQIPAAVCLATTELLAEQPLAKLTVSGILARSGVSKTSFYYHFASKEAVVASLVEQIAEELDAQVAALPSREFGAREAIRGALSAGFGLWDAHRPVLLVVQAAARAPSPLGTIWQTLVEERYVRPFAERARSAQAAGRLAAECDPLALSRALHWMTEHALYAHIAGLDRTPPDVTAEALAHVWTTSLVGAPAGAPAD
ncbi:TetR/AcrR family transcriptional regulator [Conexibacter woesei]|uniref:Transcriptional regulator, TetR family n=1 Tax=Conexibacter woesei (strain DSM 14684 / CCUG 47730 / CIP 108061 / JCM 11494 / NBRC 100937 / ID131577) TaxID=469383 RepID=D3EYS7_CONWI|nr:TetR/AcrR family transcriptional regulator [Conexibacter woesei]ADB49801.1 transcriptional regulator, TetR family [Conexibacter woesei DSM 14684]